jgi:hypothetical protein
MGLSNVGMADLRRFKGKIPIKGIESIYGRPFHWLNTTLIQRENPNKGN